MANRLCVPPAVRGNHALAETMIMVRMSAAHRKKGPRGQSFVQHVCCNTESISRFVLLEYLQAWFVLNPHWAVGSFPARALRSSLGPG